MCQQQPACRPARCWHWSVTGSPNCVSARPQLRHARWETRGRLRRRDRSQGALTARTPERRHCRRAQPRAASLQLRHRPWLCWGRQRRLRHSRPRVASPLLGAVKVSGLCSCRCCRLGLCVGVRVEPFASSIATSAVALLVVRIGVVPLREGRGASQGGRRRAEQESSPSSADARASGVAVAAARLATGLGATDMTCSGAPGGGTALGLGRLHRGRQRGGGGGGGGFAVTRRRSRRRGRRRTGAALVLFPEVQTAESVRAGP